MAKNRPKTFSLTSRTPVGGGYVCICIFAVCLKEKKTEIKKKIKELVTALYADDNVLMEIFSCNEMEIFNIDLNNINLGDTNYNEDDPYTKSF